MGITYRNYFDGRIIWKRFINIKSTAEGKRCACGSVVPSYAEEIRYPSFGSEKAQTEIIIYSDYLCPACRKVDGQLNDILRKLKNQVKIRFIDVPLHPGSLEYAKLFLYAWFESGNNLEHALKVRDILFREAQTRMPQHEVMRSLSMKGIPIKKMKTLQK